MKGNKALICFIIFSITNCLLLSSVESEVYNVGDAENWNTGVNYLTWSQRYSFNLGDILVFTYLEGQHNACEVTQATFQSCNSSTGVLGRYESGNDQITLKEAKKYWFICDIPGHCLGGMRFAVDLSSESQQQTQPPSPNQNGAVKIMSTPMIIYVVALTVLLELFAI